MRNTAKRTDAPRAHEGGEEKCPPGQIFPVCPGVARSGRRQGAQHPLAKAARASGETGPTAMRHEAAEEGTKDRTEASRNARMAVGPASSDARAGEFRRQARSGRRMRKRVEARAASWNPKRLTGRSPGGLWVPFRVPTSSIGWRLLALVICRRNMFFLCPFLLDFLLVILLLKQ